MAETEGTKKLRSQIRENSAKRQQREVERLARNAQVAARARAQRDGRSA